MIYIPRHFEANEDQILSFIKEYSFATLISDDCISKLPLILKKKGEKYYLEGHLAKLNPHILKLGSSPGVSIVFDGPHGYISPLWYSNPSQDVPTWNYTSALIKGKAEVIHSQEWLLRSVKELTLKYEKNSEWSSIVDTSYINNLSRGIFGLNIEIMSMSGKFKLSQNKNDEERSNIIKELSFKNKKLADEMKRND